MDISEKEEIKSKLDIVSLISETVKLTKQGSSYVGATSSLSKSGASLKVDPVQQVYNNFAEDDGGDVFNWIAYTEGLDIDTDFPRIIEIAAEKAGVRLEHVDSHVVSEKALISPFLQAVAGYYHSMLTPNCRAYIHEKWGISDEMIDKLMIGWAPEGNTLLKEMRDLFPEDVMRMSGLFYVRPNGKPEKDFFYNRIVFPYWKGGKPVYFIGRDPSWKAGSGSPKYIKQLVHSEKNPHISKVINNSVFYGEDSIRKADSVIITEGVTDCIKVLQEGLACISPVTIKIKEDQKEYAYQLIKNKKEVIICNDSEDNNSGKDGAIATAEYLESKGVHVKLVELPRPDGVEKVDLAEFLQTHTKEDFEKLDSNNVWEIKLHSQNVPDASVEKTRSVRRFLLNELRLMDPVTREIFIHNDVREYFKMSKKDMNTLMKSIKWEEEEEPREEDMDFFTSRGKLKVKKLGEYVMSLARFITFDDTKTVYTYRNGVYVSRGDDLISKIVQNALGDASKKQHIAEIINYVQLETLVPRSRVNHDITRINLLNGLFNIETMELEPHSPDYISIVQLPVTYDPCATCPAIDKFISEVLDEKHRELIYEILGYCMVPDTRIEKSTMFLGKGANGKSVMLSMFIEFLGAQNTSAESLHMLEKDPYSPAELYGKLANIFPDLASASLYENSTFKMFSGNESKIRAQRKYEHPFTFKNTARLIFSANNLPPVPKDNFAYFRRWMLIKFPNIFEGDRADKDLINKITTAEEMSGLFNKCVVALKRVLSEGKYSYDLSTGDVQIMYRINSDPVAAFADEMVVFSESDTLKSVMFGEYAEWCNLNGVEKLAENAFARRFKSLGYTPGRESTGSRQYVWENCAIGQSRRGSEKNTDGEKQDAETITSNNLPFSPNCNKVSYSNNIDGKKENIDVYVNNRANSGKPRRIDDPLTLLQSIIGRPIDTHDMSGISLKEKMFFIRTVLKESTDLKEAMKTCHAVGINDINEICAKMLQTGEIMKVSENEIMWTGA